MLSDNYSSQNAPITRSETRGLSPTSGALQDVSTCGPEAAAGARRQKLLSRRSRSVVDAQQRPSICASRSTAHRTEEEAEDVAVDVVLGHHGEERVAPLDGIERRPGGVPLGVKGGPVVRPEGERLVGPGGEGGAVGDDRLAELLAREDPPADGGGALEGALDGALGVGAGEGDARGGGELRLEGGGRLRRGEELDERLLVDVAPVAPPLRAGAGLPV